MQVGSVGSETTSLGFVTWLLSFGFGFFAWQSIHSLITNKYVILEELHRHDRGEYSVRILNICHATLCSCAILLYLSGLVPLYLLLVWRAFSTAFFLFDFIQIYLIYIRLSALGRLQGFKDPKQSFFHHAVTTCLMYGVGLKGKVSGLVLFYLAEIAIPFFEMTWYYKHTGRGNTIDYAWWYSWEILLYFFLRVVLVVPVAAVTIFPFLEYDKPLFALVVTLLYLAVYFMNVMNWLKMASDDHKTLILCGRHYSIDYWKVQ